MLIQAVIFDMDGLLLDTEPIYLKALERAVAEEGLSLSDELVKACSGVSSLQIERALREHYGTDVPVEEINRRHLIYAYDHLRQQGVSLKAGVLRLLAELDARKLPKGLATSTVQAVAEPLLERTGLISSFTAAVFGDQVDRGKPFPDIFLEAAARLSADPSACLVFEDSENGIRAAALAGMRPVLIPDLFQPVQEVLEASFRSYPSLRGALEDLDSLLA